MHRASDTALPSPLKKYRLDHYAFEAYLPAVTFRHDETRQCIADLWLFDGRVVPVTHGTDLKSLFALQVALTKELLHDAFCPLAVEIERLGRVAQVSAVHQRLQYLQQIVTRRRSPPEMLNNFKHGLAFTSMLHSYTGLLFIFRHTVLCPLYLQSNNSEKFLWRRTKTQY